MFYQIEKVINYNKLNSYTISDDFKITRARILVVLFFESLLLIEFKLIKTKDVFLENAVNFDIFSEIKAKK